LAAPIVYNSRQSGEPGEQTGTNHQAGVDE
jgi:hypothetical protein